VPEQSFEIIRASVAAFNERDVDAVLSFLDPDVELVPLRALLEGGDYRGHDGFRRFAGDIGEEWDELSLVIEEMRDVGDDVLVLGRFQAKGRTSGVEIDAPAGWVTTVRDGKVTRMQAYSTRDAALRATGLEA
jgi:ketosteroid isomerase-like protein